MVRLLNTTEMLFIYILSYLGTLIHKQIARHRSLVELDEGFQLSDAMYFAKNGIEVEIFFLFFSCKTNVASCFKV